MNEADIGSQRREEIRERLATLHAPMVRSIARRYANRGEPMEDLEQAACLGLVKAINGYDPRRSDKFVRYAIPTMLGELKRHFRDKTWLVHMPRRLQELRSQLNVATRQFTQEHSRSPTPAEIATVLGVTEEEATEAIIASDAYSPASLDAPISGEDGELLGDIVGAEDRALQKVVDLQALAPLLDALPRRERTILLLRFYGNKTQCQIAEQIGISQMQVSRLLQRTLLQLRRGLLA
ncbi:SigB/SigF/SigG family RNA polymerase sigma factor [Actinomadura barringtoniae]|nr:SigB/SigF/SigG family RNA polymerase sigma factor [Actinomadura barringtoniae]